MNKLAILFPLAAVAVFAQSGDNPLSGAIQSQYNAVKANITRAAEKVPAEDYSFKATDEVRSFGQIVGHVANANYFYCSAAQGEKSPQTSNIEKTATTKDALVSALKQSYEYCDKAYASLTDANATEKMKMGRGEQPKLAVLAGNNNHQWEHYGNIVTYMRLKALVPPSSEPRK